MPTTIIVATWSVFCVGMVVDGTRRNCTWFEVPNTGSLRESRMRGRKVLRCASVIGCGRHRDSAIALERDGDGLGGADKSTVGSTSVQPAVSFRCG
ncbi:hypothetical protein [Ruania albidiflava]|uniref:hypothetical protein n=1 Tax=Ruania albidiflava TaxID=366586 RepID=UPI0023F22364|nr:hypothetical protein [Ruania albidiflava]